ncbi:hypothetical protein GT147_002405 [Salmonella enterica]|nr:hypothetical protein [Salmonella enterica subsp. enterica serovar Infantis]EDW6857290.1 hypothetical protein [Salmonella enterica]EEJ5736435.1 hypothetical protein [Salmonella enterica]
MTDSNIVFSDSFYQAFCDLRSSIDAIACAADMIPEGGEDESLGHLFRVLSQRVESDLTAFLYTFKTSS